MIISRTPLRVSFAGGGSDVPAFYRQEPGVVVSTAIDRYVYINVNSKFDSAIRASYSVTEIVAKVSDLQHELIREALQLVGVEGGIEITSISDIPSEGTGLGSSSAYTVGLLNALHAHQHRHTDAERLAREACCIEIDRCDKPIGKQDQYIAAYGGLQLIQFNPDETVFVDPIVCRPETKRRLRDGLLMLYTGITRSADGILQEQSQNIAGGRQQRNKVRQMTELARNVRDALCSDDLCAVGEILHAGWVLKRELASGVTSSRIDEYYACARQHGALGGKILGAGGGGFLLLFAPPERHVEITSALAGMRVVPFGLEPQGSKIIYVEENAAHDG